MDVVVGQPDAQSNASGLDAAQLKNPRFVDSNGNQLAVADQNNNRVLLWNAFPDANTPADVVLGQADFTHGTANDDDQNRVADTAPSARTL